MAHGRFDLRPLPSEQETQNKLADSKQDGVVLDSGTSPATHEIPSTRDPAHKHINTRSRAVEKQNIGIAALKVSTQAKMSRNQ